MGCLCVNVFVHLAPGALRSHPLSRTLSNVLETWAFLIFVEVEAAIIVSSTTGEEIFFVGQMIIKMGMDCLHDRRHSDMIRNIKIKDSIFIGGSFYRSFAHIRRYSHDMILNIA